MMAQFNGFPQQTLDFLSAITENNNKAWFEAHRDDYNAYIKEQGQVFASVLGVRLQEIVPELVVDPRANGSGNMLRFYRDTRFSKDKSPYKTNISMWFWQGAGKKMARPGFGFQLEPTGCGVAAGQFGFPKPMLETYRQAVVHDELGPALVEAVAQIRGAGEYTIEGEQYKQVPRGFNPDHPRADWLKFGGLWASSPRIPPEVITSPELVDVMVEHCRVMAPVQHWLIEVEKRLV